jgi:O-antigen ligase
MGVLIFLIGSNFLGLIFSEVARWQITSSAGITLLDLTVGMTGLYWIGYSLKKKLPLYPKDLEKPIVLFVCVILLSLFFAALSLTREQLINSSLYALRWFFYTLALGYAVYAAKTKRATIEALMIGSGAVVVILGFIQYFFYNNLRNLFYLGWDDHLYRLFSTFFDPNFAGMFLVLFLLFMLGTIWDQKRVLSKKYVVYTGICLFTLGSIFLTYSRSASIMLFVGIIIFLLLGKQRKLAIISVICIVIAISLFANTKIEGLNPFRTASSFARVASVKNALVIIQDHPVLGVGFNAYRYAQIAYHFRSDTTPFPSHADSGTDNSFLFIFATTGIVGLFSYLYFLYSLTRGSLRSEKSKHRGLVAAVGAWCVGSFFINGLFYPVMLFWMFFLRGVTEE